VDADFGAISKRGANEENLFGCLGGGNADGTQHGAVVSGLLLPSSLLPSLLLLPATATAAPSLLFVLLWSAARGDLLTKLNPEPGDLNHEVLRLCSGYPARGSG
jgi:hypothetical protein